jgi:hypothetical protein
MKAKMFVRSILASCLLLTPVVSFASEALAYIHVYQCNADKINEDMVDMCANEFPDLSREANDALAAWRERNLAKADAAQKACLRDLSETSNSASKGEAQATRMSVADITAKIHSNFLAEIRKDGRAPCVDAFSQLRTPGWQTDVR